MIMSLVLVHTCPGTGRCAGSAETRIRLGGGVWASVSGDDTDHQRLIIRRGDEVLLDDERKGWSLEHVVQVMDLDGDGSGELFAAWRSRSSGAYLLLVCYTRTPFAERGRANGASAPSAPAAWRSVEVTAALEAGRLIRFECVPAAGGVAPAPGGSGGESSAVRCGKRGVVFVVERALCSDNRLPPLLFAREYVFFSPSMRRGRVMTTMYGRPEGWAQSLNLAAEYMERGRWKDAERCLMRLLEGRSANGLPRGRLADVWRMLFVCNDRMGRRRRAAEWIRKALCPGGSARPDPEAAESFFRVLTGRNPLSRSGGGGRHGRKPEGEESSR